MQTKKKSSETKQKKPNDVCIRADDVRLSQSQWIKKKKKLRKTANDLALAHCRAVCTCCLLFAVSETRYQMHRHRARAAHSHQSPPTVCILKKMLKLTYSIWKMVCLHTNVGCGCLLLKNSCAILSAVATAVELCLVDLIGLCARPSVLYETIAQYHKAQFSLWMPFSFDSARRLIVYLFFFFVKFYYFPPFSLLGWLQQ